MPDLLGSKGNVIDADLFAVFGSPLDLKSEDRLFYEWALADNSKQAMPLTDAAHVGCLSLMRALRITFREALVIIRDESSHVQEDPAVYDAPVWSVDLNNQRSQEGRAMKKVLTGNIPAYRESKLGKEYRGFRKAIDDKWAKGQGCGQHKAVNLSKSSFFSDNLGIRAAFYVNWGAPQSFNSLEKNINKLNLVLPEWLFIDPIGDTIYNTIDKKALKIMKTAGVKIMPLLSNNYQSVFRKEAVTRIINNPAKKQKLINDLLNVIISNGFDGISIDIEDLELDDDAPFIAFQKDLYEKFHAQGLMVSQNAIPFNDDYNYKALSQYNDYMILMAYDQHHAETLPGPISSQKWIEAAVDKMADDVPTEKIILAMAAYGHDWKMNKKKVTHVEDLTYQQALTAARDAEVKVDFDNDTYTLHYQYYDDEDSLHEVHFNDAATNFNTLRFATEYNLAGTAIWRLGGEDTRIWSFYDKPMSKEALVDFDFKALSNIDAGDKPDYLGEGEILDIIATPKAGHITTELDSSAMLISEEDYTALPSTYVIRKFGDTKKRKLVLSYDDGPDPTYTPQILDTLSKYHVPASFFLVGIEAENNIPLVPIDAAADLRAAGVNRNVWIVRRGPFPARLLPLWL